MPPIATLDIPVSSNSPTFHAIGPSAVLPAVLMAGDRSDITIAGNSFIQAGGISLNLSPNVDFKSVVEVELLMRFSYGGVERLVVRGTGQTGSETDEPYSIIHTPESGGYESLFNSISGTVTPIVLELEYVAPIFVTPVVIAGGLSGELVGVVALGLSADLLLRSSAYAAETEEVWLVLLTLSHPDLPDDIRIVNNTEPIQSRGQDYVPLAFDIVLPSDTEERPPLAEVRIDNVSRDLTESIRSISDAPTATIEVIVASNPDEAVVSYTGFRLIGIGWDAADVTGQLVLDDISIEPFPAGRFTPASFPGLF